VDYIPKIESNDLLDIKLVSANDDASKLFTPPIDNSKSAISYSSGVAARGGYLVDVDGVLELPFIGKMKVAGKTRSELESEIESKLSEYIKEPIIQIQIINFKITVLGEVGNPGTFNVPNEKITIFEALGVAGDLNITGKRKDIIVIREVGKKRMEFTVDLTSKDIFHSPVYFLKQNDLIYVSPNKAKINTSSYSQIYMPILSSLSLLLSAITLFLRY
jgi:polysaccharide export outer membrane protein